MGRGMMQLDSKFKIKAKNKEKALISLKTTINLKSRMKGGTLENREFSFVDMNYINSDTLENALSKWRWNVENNSSGDINKIEFLGEKVGECKVMFSKIAPFVENGSYINIRVEDIYRRNVTMLETLTFENCKLNITRKKENL